MKKLLVLAAIAVFGLTANAQDTVDKVMKEIEGGGFKVGANIGLPLAGAGDVSNFNVGADVAYLFEVMDNLEVGGLVGISYYFGDGDYFGFEYDDNIFIPISTTARYYFADRKFFGGLDVGYAVNASGDANGGLYLRPKFGYNLGIVNLIASYTSISGGYNYDYLGTSVSLASSFASFNVGAEFSF